MLMFLILSKIVNYFLLPSNLLLAIGLAGLALQATRWRRAGRRLLVASFALLLVTGILPAGSFLRYTLEQRFPPWSPARGAPDGIIVLGGAINPLLSRIYGEPQMDDSAERVTAIAKLARAYPNARIVYSGGDPSLLATKGREADYLYPLLDSFGVPRDRVILENRARNTYENAVFTRDLVNPKPGERWLVVTSAQHMPRAIGCFRRVDFPVEAYPVDWRGRPSFSFGVNFHIVAGLGQLDNVMHEWIGLLAYRLRGRTGEFFPSPDATR